MGHDSFPVIFVANASIDCTKSLSPDLEKGLDETLALFLQHTPRHVNIMIVRKVFECPASAFDRPRLGFGRPINQTSNSGVYQGTYTHQTGFQRDIHRDPGKSIVIFVKARRPYRDYFCVRSRVGQCTRLVVTATNDFVTVYDDGTYGNFINRYGQSCLV